MTIDELKKARTKAKASDKRREYHRLKMLEPGYAEMRRARRRELYHDGGLNCPSREARRSGSFSAAEARLASELFATLAAGGDVRRLISDPAFSRLWKTFLRMKAHKPKASEQAAAE